MINSPKTQCFRLPLLFFLTSLCISTIYPQAAAKPQRSDMGVVEARFALRKAMMSMMGAGSIFACCGREKMQIYDSDPPLNLIINSNGYSFIEKGRIGSWTSACLLLCPRVWGPANEYEWNMNVRFGGRSVAVKECKKQYGIVWFGTKSWMMNGIKTWARQADAQLFADAFNVLNAAALNRDPAKDAAEFDAFMAAAKAWREAAVKPELPEAAYREKVLAEEAIREKNLEAAIVHYNKGLQIAPIWPEGHFNVALLEAEFTNFEYAVWHMKRYLALLPDAPDARAARDKMIIWESKIQPQK